MSLHCWNQLAVVFLVFLNILLYEFSAIKECIVQLTSNNTLLYFFFEKNWCVSWQIDYAVIWQIPFHRLVNRQIPFNRLVNRQFIWELWLLGMLILAFESICILVLTILVELCYYIHYLVFVLLGRGSTRKILFKFFIVMQACIVFLLLNFFLFVPWRFSFIF